MAIFPTRFFSNQQRLICCGPFLASLQLLGISYFLSGESSELFTVLTCLFAASYLWMLVAYSITGARARGGSFTFLSIDLARRPRSPEEERWRRAVLWLSGLLILAASAKLLSANGVPHESQYNLIMLWAVQFGAAALAWAAVVVDAALVVWVASGFRVFVI